MLVRKSQSKKKSITGLSTGLTLDSSLTSIEWLPKMQIGENPLPSSTTISTPPILQPSSIPTSATLPITLSKINPLPKAEPHEIELPTSSAVHLKPPYSYVTLIRQAIMSGNLQRMTLNEIYQWIIDSYPYFRAAPPKWKNSIRHNLSLNKCFKRLQRSTNDPGKGSYWAVDESNETSASASRKRRFEEIPPSLHVLPSSPTAFHQHPTAFYTNNNPMIYDVGSIGGQSSSADESDSTMSLAANTSLIQWDDLNLDLTASFRRFREQILEGPSTNWINPSDAPTTSTAAPTSWGHDLFPHGETNSFFESVKLASSGEINWHDIDVKPYCEFLDGFRTNSSFQQQDRDKLLNLASSLSSFFDHTGITHLAQNKITHDPIVSNRYPGISNRMIVESTNNLSSLPVVVEDEAFDWDSIT